MQEIMTIETRLKMNEFHDASNIENSSKQVKVDSSYNSHHNIIFCEYILDLHVNKTGSVELACKIFEIN